MDKEIAKAINNVSKKVNEIAKDQKNNYSELFNYNSDEITAAQEAIAETYEITDTNSSDITDVQLAIAELYELLEG